MSPAICWPSMASSSPSVNTTGLPGCDGINIKQGSGLVAAGELAVLGEDFAVAVSVFRNAERLGQGADPTADFDRPQLTVKLPGDDDARRQVVGLTVYADFAPGRVVAEVVAPDGLISRGLAHFRK